MRLVVVRFPPPRDRDQPRDPRDQPLLPFTTRCMLWTIRVFGNCRTPLEFCSSRVRALSSHQGWFCDLWLLQHALARTQLSDTALLEYDARQHMTCTRSILSVQPEWWLVVPLVGSRSYALV